MRRSLLAAVGSVALVVAGLSTAQAAQATTAGSGDSYKIGVSTGASMLTGSTDSGVHCYGGCGTYLYSPFPIAVYGQTYSQMYVSSSGTVQFGDAVNTTNAQTCLPTSSFNGPTFMPYWNYSYTPQNYGYGIFYRTYGSAPYRQFVVEWREEDANTGNYQNFSQAFSEGSGVVTTTYATTGGQYATVGAQNASGSTASQYSCNASDGATYPGLQITYTPTSTTPTGTVPAAPTQLSVTADPNDPKAYVHWEAPTSDGGSPITGYVISRDGNSSTGGGPYTSPTLPASQRDGTFGKLIAGATYHFSVQAINTNGTGPAATITFTEPAAGSKPGAPRIGTATAGAAGGAITAKIAWSAPAGTTSPAVNGYKVYAYRVVNGKNVETMVSSKLAASLRTYSFPLDHTGQWRFKVQAINSLGASPLSAYSNTVAGR